MSKYIYISTRIFVPSGTARGQIDESISISDSHKYLMGVSVKPITPTSEDLSIGVALISGGKILDNIPLSIVNADSNSNPNNQYLDVDSMVTDSKIELPISVEKLTTSDVTLIVSLKLSRDARE